ncbi:isoprenylcysteine carboxyl methyltransferase family protein [Oceanibacterium hippocampi]|uniref:Isoprenylcysteine carboxyl methyltransferase (ICMT) family protein n=1 Tax=Oceanibacterium hippocampi TaxID=745714 RepID=A0A1Y5T952_9PROT|nr:isoprenylcysteine carboxylmethyltransferase family protein [Oceanibacterium hippocampi]SLN55126.1 Isoprenylcysteine carboxyl methyltransferase (ICMT) family protein [Oceanibacterium hippocampi]
MTTLGWVLLYLVLQRLGELAYARRNEGRLRAAGAREVGARHYPLFILLHGGWLVALAVGVPWNAPASIPLLAFFVVVQGLRYWTLASLGRYWTTRILTVDGAPLVRRGPYRLLRHPNYLVVVLEIALAPLIFGAWQIAAVFSLLNALLLAWRIRVESRALAPRRPLANDG